MTWPTLVRIGDVAFLAGSWEELDEFMARYGIGGWVRSTPNPNEIHTQPRTSGAPSPMMPAPTSEDTP